VTMLVALQEQYGAEQDKRATLEAELEATIEELEAQKRAASNAAAAAALRMKELGEELEAATEVLNRQEGENMALQAQTEAIRSQYLVAQDSVEAEQGVVIRMQKEIARLKRYEIDNEYLVSENSKIKGELKGLNSNLTSTRGALEAAKADAERQRKKSEATLSELQSALESIQEQVLSVVNDSDSGTQVVKAGVAQTPPLPEPVVDTVEDGLALGGVQPRALRSAGTLGPLADKQKESVGVNGSHER
jgi:chromosome segregation ATPase